jgi:hypothetical protein
MPRKQQNTQLDPKVLEAVDALAIREERSRSAMISILVREALAARAQSDKKEGD